MAPPTILFALDRIVSGYVGGLPGIHAMYAGTDFRWERPIRQDDRVVGESMLHALIEKVTISPAGCAPCLIARCIDGWVEAALAVGRTQEASLLPSESPGVAPAPPSSARTRRVAFARRQAAARAGPGARAGSRRLRLLA